MLVSKPNRKQGIERLVSKPKNEQGLWQLVSKPNRDFTLVDLKPRQIFELAILQTKMGVYTG